MNNSNIKWLNVNFGIRIIIITIAVISVAMNWNSLNEADVERLKVGIFTKINRISINNTNGGARWFIIVFVDTSEAFRIVLSQLIFAEMGKRENLIALGATAFLIKSTSLFPLKCFVLLVNSAARVLFF